MYVWYTGTRIYDVLEGSIPSMGVRLYYTLSNTLVTRFSVYRCHTVEFITFFVVHWRYTKLTCPAKNSRFSAGFSVICSPNILQGGF
jgi:hypothetical protein